MRKKWLVFTLILAFLAAAAAAEAGSVPGRMNGSSWNYTAFQMDKYKASPALAATPYAAYGTMLNSTYNSTGDGQLKGTIDVFSSTGGPYATFVLGGSNSSVWRANAHFGDAGVSINTRTNSTDGLLALDITNCTNTGTSANMNVNRALYFINNPAQTLFASLSPNILGKKEAGAANPDDGPHLGLMVQNLTISNNVSDVAGTWYFYSLEGTNASNIAARAGAMVLTSTGGAGSMSYGSLFNNSSANSTSTDTVTWGAVDSGTAININGTALGILCDKAFLSQDKNIVIGYRGPAAAGAVRTLVGLKSGATFSSSSFASAGFSSVEITNTNGTSQSDGRIATFYTDSNRAITAGNYTAFQSNQTRVIDSLVGRTATVGTATVGGVTQSTMKLTGGTYFIGRTVSDVYAGIVYDSVTNATLGLQILFPAATSVNAPVAPTTAEVTTLNTLTFSGGGTLKVVSGAEVGTSGATSQGGTNLGTLASRFENSTSEEIKTTYGLGSGATINRNFGNFNFGVNIGAANGGNFTVRKITFGGNNKLISELPVPTKFYVAAVTTATGTAHAVNTYKTYTYRNAGSSVSDGSYWITPSGFPALTLNYNDANRLTLGSNYDMWLAIQDNGDYDLAPAGGMIADPGAFVDGLGGGGGGTSSSSSDGGCVLNPAAGLSVEMLLLMLAPLAYFIRRRKK